MVLHSSNTSASHAQSLPRRMCNTMCAFEIWFGLPVTYSGHPLPHRKEGIMPSEPWTKRPIALTKKQVNLLRYVGFPLIMFLGWNSAIPPLSLSIHMVFFVNLEKNVHRGRPKDFQKCRGFTWLTIPAKLLTWLPAPGPHPQNTKIICQWLLILTLCCLNSSCLTNVWWSRLIIFAEGFGRCGLL